MTTATHAPTLAEHNAQARRHHAATAAGIAADLAAILDYEARAAAPATGEPAAPGGMAHERRTLAADKLHRITAHLVALEQAATPTPCTAPECRKPAAPWSPAHAPVCGHHYQPAP